MTIIGLVGFIGSGKDTVANMLVGNNGIKDSFAKPLKDAAAAIFGWPRELLEGDTAESREFRETPDIFWSRKLGIDNFTPRYALQYLGTNVLRTHFSPSIWIDSLEYRLTCQGRAAHDTIVISDVRFANEIEVIKSFGGRIVQVQRVIPEWYHVAIKAKHGNTSAARKMATVYKDVHLSEWDWVGVTPDYVIHNTGTLAQLEEQVQHIKSAI